MSQPDDAAAARVLVIDDEPQIRRFLDISLRAQGYEVETAGNAAKALGAGGHARRRTWSSSTSACPIATATTCCAELRQWSQVPVIMLTVRARRSARRCAALDAGANDYVTKPFGVQELMARLRALLRTRAGGPERAAGVRRRPSAVDLARREVHLRRRTAVADAARNTPCWPCCCITPAASSPSRSCCANYGARPTSRTRTTCASWSASCGRSWATTPATRAG